MGIPHCQSGPLDFLYLSTHSLNNCYSNYYVPFSVIYRLEKETTEQQKPGQAMKHQFNNCTSLDFQGKIAYGYKTNSFGSIEFLLKLERKKSWEKGIIKLMGKEKISKPRRSMRMKKEILCLKEILFVWSWVSYSAP